MRRCRRRLRGRPLGDAGIARDGRPFAQQPQTSALQGVEQQTGQRPLFGRSAACRLLAGPVHQEVPSAWLGGRGRRRDEFVGLTT